MSFLDLKEVGRLEQVLYSPFFWLLYFFVIAILSRVQLRLFYKKGWTSRNYLGEPIAQSFGLNLCLHFLFFLFLSYGFSFVAWTPFSFESRAEGSSELFLFLLLILTLSLMGWLDDHYGTKKIKGFKGHFRAFFVHGKFTSGLLKAILGTFISIYVSFSMKEELLLGVVASLVLIFSIHLFNLLDVRPGRCIKSFWFLLVLILPFSLQTQLIIYFAPIFFSTLVLFHFDRKRLAMLGDTGSNVLGGIYGFILISFSMLQVQLVILTLFIVLSIVSERHSFTDYINKSPWLSKIDRWGIS